MIIFRSRFQYISLQSLIWLVVAIAFGRVCYRIFTLQSQLGLDSQSYVRASRGLSITGNPYGWQTDQVGPYLYPPLLAIMGVPLNRLTIEVASYVWVIASVICAVLLIVVLQRFVGWRLSIIGVLCFPSTWSTIIYGQINMLIAVLIAVAIFAMMRQREDLVGILLGFGFLLKLTPIVALLLLAFQRHWCCLRGALMVVAVMIVGTLSVTSLHIWQQGFTIANSIVWVSPAIVSLTGILAYHYHAIGYALSRIFAVGMIMWTFWRSQHLSGERAIAASTLLMLIIAPITWEHHLVLALPVFALLWRQNMRGLMLCLWGALALMDGVIISIVVIIGWVACCWPDIRCFQDGYFFRQTEVN